MNFDSKNDSTSPETVELPRDPISENTAKALEVYGEMVESDYREFKEGFMRWLLTRGKNTYKNTGYSESTVVHTHYKIDEAFRWKWEQDGEYTTEFTHGDATALIEILVTKSSHPDRYVYNFEKCVRRYFKYLRDERGREIDEWEHNIPIEQTKGSSEHIKDKFYPEEMNAIYEAALNRYSIPNLYSDTITERERDELKALLAQRYGKSKDEITQDTFNAASSWKIPSIIAVTSDTGLRPIEVGRAKAEWFDTDRGEMVVPAEEATKNKEYWNCRLSGKAINAVRNWTRERASYEKYHDEEGMWLTRYGNPYKARSLNRILNDLIEEAGITERNRNLSWYSFRHGAATAWIEQEGLSRAKTQLRHNSIKTTEKYKRDGGNESGGGDSYW